MFSIEISREILSTIKKNKLRTFLTGFSVAWGIFILVILLGSGNGLENGVRKEFEGDALNSIWIWGQQTSMPYKGLKENRPIILKNDDYERTIQLNDEVVHISSRYWVGQTNINYKDKYGNFDIVSVHPDTKYIERTMMKRGRFLNEIDMKQDRKVVIIGELVRKALFDEEEDPLGKYVKMRGFLFKVVGVFEDGYEWDNRRVYIPISVAQRIFNPAKTIHNISMVTNTMDVEESKALVEKIRAQFATAHKFDKEDQRAIGVANVLEYYEKFQKLFKGIGIFVGIIGILTIIAGVVGVSNIMMIAVNERTKEIGIRKAVGATPGSIVSLIMVESVIITSVAGYLGLVFGVGVLELASKYLPQNNYFLNPEVNMSTAFFAVFLLVLGGALAGLYPARKAANVKPIVALRDE